MTRTEMLAELKIYLRETSYDAMWGDNLLLSYLAEGQDKFCDETGFFVDATNYTFATVSGTASYALPSRIISVLDVFNASGQRLQHINEDDRYLRQQLDRSSYQMRPRTSSLIATGTAQGGTTSTVTLDLAASVVNDFYNGYIIKFTNDAPAGIRGQQHTITDYVGATKVATVAGTPSVLPIATSTYTIEKVVETDQGQPAYWQTDYDSGSIKLLPTPVDTETMQLRVWRYSRVALDAVGANPEIPIQFQRACVEYAAFRAMMHHDLEKQDKVKATDHLSVFKNYCEDGRKARRRYRSEETMFSTSPNYTVRL